MHNFSTKITHWYQQNKRDLPWRNTRDPYFIWLSEIILQQTRVDQGMPYYLKFVKAFPDVEKLAKADEATVLKLWQGLGYYSRARNLHSAARHVVNELNGKFPDSFTEIIKLKGIGEYTAAAISSFAFGEARAVVDGNVFRVLSRVFGVSTPFDSTEGKKEFIALANELLNKTDPGTHNQAIMEFGAVQCKPQNPDCISCTLNVMCYAFTKKKVQEFPVKSKTLKTRDRFFNYIVLRYKDKFLLKKRTAKDIWQNMYDFPLIETPRQITEKKLMQTEEWNELLKGQKYILKNISGVHKHILSHQKIYAKFYELNLKNDFAKQFLSSGNFIAVTSKSLAKYAIPRLVENYLDLK